MICLWWEMSKCLKESSVNIFLNKIQIIISKSYIYLFTRLLRKLLFSVIISSLTGCFQFSKMCGNDGSLIQDGFYIQWKLPYIKKVLRIIWLMRLAHGEGRQMFQKSHLFCEYYSTWSHNINYYKCYFLNFIYVLCVIV